MNSPFAFFRKHQATAMVITLVLVMFVFTVGDSLMQISGELPTILIYLTCMFIGGSILWAMGLRREKAKEYTAVGVLVGFAVAFVMMTFLFNTAEQAVISTTIGDYSEKELNSLLRERQIANQFVEAAYSKISPPPNLPNVSDPRFIQFIQQQMDNWRRGMAPYMFGFGLPPQQDVVMGEIMQKEADKLDVVISDEAITEFIQELTQEKMGLKEFSEITKQLQIGESELYRILRKQRRAQLTANLLIPQSLPTPENYWEVFEQVNVARNAEVTAIPVKEFESKVGDAPAAELEELFKQYSKQFPAPDGTPGFRQPRKVKIAYLEADYKAIEKSLPKITEAEIKAYYEKNKASYPYNPFPEGEFGVEIPKDRQPLVAPVPKLDEEKPKENTPEEKPTEKPAENPTEKPAEKPAEKPTEKPKEKPADNKAPAKDAEGDKDQARLQELKSQTVPILFQDDAKAPAEPAKDAEKKETPKPEPKDPKSETKPEPKDPETPKPETKPEAKPEPKDPVAAPPKPTNKLPEAPTLPARGPLDPPKQQYRPLDDNLRLEIEETLMTQKALAKINQLMTTANERMGEISIPYKDAIEEEEKAAAVKVISTEMEKLAKELGLRYVPIEKPLSAEELSNTEEYPIGSATEVREDDNPTAVNERVVSTAFGSDSTTYVPFRAKDELESNNQFVWWKTADIDPHVPAYDDPGVKEQVEKAWRTIKARELAEARAKELAEKAKKADKKLIDILGQETITGDKEKDEDGNPKSPQLTFRETGSFTRLQLPPPNPRNPMAQRQLQMTDLVAVPNAGGELLRTLFDKIEVGSTGVALDQDKSNYYVIHVVSQSPASEIGEKLLKERFLKADFTSPRSIYAPLVINEQRYLMERGYFLKLMEKYDFKFGNQE